MTEIRHGEYTLRVLNYGSMGVDFRIHWDHGPTKTWMDFTVTPDEWNTIVGDMRSVQGYDTPAIGKNANDPRKVTLAHRRYDEACEDCGHALIAHRVTDHVCSVCSVCLISPVL